MAQDVALSRRKQGFESPRERQFSEFLKSGKILTTPNTAHPLTFTDKFKEEMAKYVAIAALSLLLFALAAIWILPSDLLPTFLINRLDEFATGTTLLRITLLTIGLFAWIIYLKPWLRFDQHLGIFRDIKTGLHYCTSCKTEKKIHTPLQRLEGKGWYCVNCKWIYGDHVKKTESKRRTISSGVERI